METQFGFYPMFYVKKKDLLFPLIEKYTGQSLKGKTHGEVIQLYYSLLKTNDSFVNEVDGLIAGQNFKNAGGFLPSVLSVVGGLFGAKGNEAASDEAFYETLAEQNRADTMKILIISGVTIVILGLSVFLVIKLRKK